MITKAVSFPRCFAMYYYVHAVFLPNCKQYTQFFFSKLFCSM